MRVSGGCSVWESTSSKPGAEGCEWEGALFARYKLVEAVQVGLAEHSNGIGNQEPLNKYKEVFTDELGTIHPHEARLSVPETAKPKVMQVSTCSFCNA